MEILFEKGIPGFEDYKYFNVNVIKETEKFLNIVSKEDDNIGFISISPFEIKKDYPDTLLFFRLGDFYEMFFEDAKIAPQ